MGARSRPQRNSLEVARPACTVRKGPPGPITTSSRSNTSRRACRAQPPTNPNPNARTCICVPFSIIGVRSRCISGISCGIQFVPPLARPMGNAPHGRGAQDGGEGLGRESRGGICSTTAGLTPTTARRSSATTATWLKRCASSGTTTASASVYSPRAPAGPRVSS